MIPGRSLVVGLVLLAGLGADALAAPRTPWPVRRRLVEGGLRPGVHELKSLDRWPAEPASPADVDGARFRAALQALCEGMAVPRALARLADDVRAAAGESGVDPFLLAAIVYRESRCNPRYETPYGVGLLQIQPGMYVGNVRGKTLTYRVRQGTAEAGDWVDRTRSLPPAALHPVKLKESRHNLQVGAALLAMWQDQHAALDDAFPGVPHRSAVAHFGWGDRVWGTGGEDRAFIARRRLVELYEERKPLPRTCSLGFDVVSPLDGTPRVAPSGPGEDRDDGARAHRGLDIDATIGEPVRSIADGVVWFTGFDLPGSVKPQVVKPEDLPTTQRPPLGPGGLFVCVRHVEGIFSCYMHLSTYRVRINQRVKAGDVIAAVGVSGVKASGSHLHLEVHVKSEAIDPAPVLGPELVIPPQDTVAHDLAMEAKAARLKKEKHARWKAWLASRRHE